MSPQWTDKTLWVASLSIWAREVYNFHMLRHRRYAPMAVSTGVVWAAILILGAIVDRHRFTGTVFDVLLMVFGGFMIGWLLATITRARDERSSRD